MHDGSLSFKPIIPRMFEVCQQIENEYSDNRFWNGTSNVAELELLRAYAA